MPSPEAAEPSNRERARAIVDSSSALGRLAKGVGGELAETEAALAKAEGSLASEDLGTAIDLAKKAWKRSEKVLQEHLSSSFSKAQSLILAAKNLSRDVAPVEDLLSRARTAMENNDFQSALDFTNEALETITDDMTSAVDKEVHEVEDLIRTAAELGADTTKATTLIERARGDIGNLDFEKAKNAIRQSRAESEKALQRSLDGRAGDFSKFVQDARALGADPAIGQESFDKAEAAIKKGNYREGAQLAKQGFQAIQQAQFQRLGGVSATSREKFPAAANRGIDLQGPMAALTSARDLLKRGAFREALDAAKRADGAVDAIINGYRTVEGRLKEIHRAFAEAEAFGVQTVRARKLAEAARQAYQERNLADVAKAVDAAAEELRKAERERVMQSIERAEFVLTVGEQAGADLGEPSRLLQDAIVATKADEHRKALQLAGDAQAKAERILGDRASEKIGALRGALPHLGDDAGTLKALLNRADASIGTRDFEDTFRALAEGERFVEIQIRTHAEEIVGDLALAVRMGVDLGANVALLETIHRELNGFLTRGQTGDIVAAREKARALLGSASEELLAFVRARITTAHGLKIDVDEMSDLARRSRLAFGVQNYHEGLRLLNEANERAPRPGGEDRDRRPPSPGRVRGGEGGDEGEGIREGARPRATRRAGVHRADPGEAHLIPDFGGSGPRLRGGREPRAIERRDRQGAPAPRRGRTRTGGGPHAPAAGAARRLEEAGGRGDDGPAPAPGDGGRRGRDEPPAVHDDRLARARGPRIQDGTVRRGPRPRRAGGGRGVEGTRPRNRRADARLRGDPQAGPHGRNRHPIRGATVRAGARVLPGEEVPPGDCGRRAERGRGGTRRPPAGYVETGRRVGRAEAPGDRQGPRRRHLARLRFPPDVQRRRLREGARHRDPFVRRDRRSPDPPRGDPGCAEPGPGAPADGLRGRRRFDEVREVLPGRRGRLRGRGGRARELRIRGQHRLGPRAPEVVRAGGAGEGRTARRDVPEDGGRPHPNPEQVLGGPHADRRGELPGRAGAHPVRPGCRAGGPLRETESSHPRGRGEPRPREEIRLGFPGCRGASAAGERADPPRRIRPGHGRGQQRPGTGRVREGRREAVHRPHVQGRDDDPKRPQVRDRHEGRRREAGPGDATAEIRFFGVDQGRGGGVPRRLGGDRGVRAEHEGLRRRRPGPIERVGGRDPHGREHREGTRERRPRADPRRCGDGGPGRTPDRRRTPLRGAEVPTQDDRVRFRAAGDPDHLPSGVRQQGGHAGDDRADRRLRARPGEGEATRRRPRDPVPDLQGTHQDRIQGHPLRLRPGLPRAVRDPRGPLPGLLPLAARRRRVIRRGGPRRSPRPRGVGLSPSIPGSDSRPARASGPRRAGGPRSGRTRTRPEGPRLDEAV